MSLLHVPQFKAEGAIRNTKKGALSCSPFGRLRLCVRYVAPTQTGSCASFGRALLLAFPADSRAERCSENADVGRRAFLMQGQSTAAAEFCTRWLLATSVYQGCRAAQSSARTGTGGNCAYNPLQSRCRIYSGISSFAGVLFLDLDVKQFRK